jgi:hypothetical protein
MANPLKTKKNKILALFFEFINALLIIDVILTSLCLHFKKKRQKNIFFLLHASNFSFITSL